MGQRGAQLSLGGRWEGPEKETRGPPPPEEGGADVSSVSPEWARVRDQVGARLQHQDTWFLMASSDLSCVCVALASCELMLPYLLR